MSEPTEFRDLDARPYSADEERVGTFLSELAPDIGWGNDPIGFLIASYRVLAAQRLESRPSTSGQEISEAIKEVLEASDEFREGMGPEWEGDPLTDACDRLRAAFQAAQKG